MKTTRILLMTALLAAVSTLNPQLSAATPMGTAFNYQGKLRPVQGQALKNKI